MTKLIKKIILGSNQSASLFFNRKKNVSLIEKYIQIGKVSSGLIHDLISPITALQIHFELIDENLLKNPEYIKSVKDATTNIGEYAKLVKEYIGGDYTKKEIDLTQEVQSSVELVSYNAIKNNIQIHFIRKSGIKIHASPVYIYQIMISLLSNAIESFSENQTNRKIIIKIENINNEIILSVRDFGRGIKEIKKIFNLFYTTKQDKGGTGIGLSSVRYIVEKELNGKLEVETELEKGSIFKIILPT